MNRPRRRPLLRPCCAMLVAATLSSSPQRAVADNASPPWIAHPVAQFGGAIGAMAVDTGTAATSDGPIVWLGRGPRVEAISLRDPAAPMVVGRSTWLGGTISALAVDDGLGVAIVQPSAELVALDLRDAARPVMRWRTALDRWAGGVELAGEFAYVALPTSITVVHVDRFAAPKVVTPDLIGDDVEVVDHRVVGRLLAVTVLADEAPDGGPPVPQLRLYDLADPASPQLVGTLDDASLGTLGAGPGARDGGRVYACDWRRDVVAVDVSVPRRPHVVQRWPLAEDEREGCDSGIEGGLQIDADGSPFGVFGWSTGAVASLGDVPRAGDPPSTQPPSIMQPLPYGVMAAVLLGRNVVVADNAGNVSVVDTGVLVHQPGSDAVAGTQSGIGQVVGLGRRGDVDDGRLYAMQRYDGLSVLSLDAPQQPAIVDRVRADGIRGFGHTDLSIFGGLAVMTLDPGCRDCFTRPVDVFDLRSAGAPRHLGRIANGTRTWLMTKGDETWAIHGGTLRGDVLRHNLSITPIDRLSEPPVATFTPDHNLTFGALAGDRFVAIGVQPDMEFGACAWRVVEVWDLSVPVAPRRETRYDIPMCLSYDTSMALVDNILYVAAGIVSGVPDTDAALIVLSLQPDGSARELGRLPLPGAGSDLSFDNGRLFVKTSCPYDASQGCIHVIDVRAPPAPRLEGLLFAGPNGGRLVVRGSLVYLLDHWDGGVWVFELPVMERPPRVDPHRLVLPWLARGAPAASAP